MRLILTWNDAAEPSVRVFIAPATVVIGRDPTCEVVLKDERVSRQHVKIRLESTGAQLQDVSNRGAVVNGKRVPKCDLDNGDRIQIGKLELQVQLVAGSTLRDLGSARAIPALADAPLTTGPIEVAGYRFGRCLGQGAYGAVFEATNAVGTVVAIKVMKLSSGVADEDEDRFQREAATASSLVHPNVVRILDHGQSGAIFYIVMEFVAGETARDLVQRNGPLPIRRALKIGRAVASALEAARAAHLVHRDIKPENVLLGNDGSIKLADFGSAKSVLTAGQSGLTREGDVLGTLAYMSPEQLASAIYADHRSDLYSLGATLYHLLAGVTPFQAATQIDSFRMIVKDTPKPIGELREDVPPLVRIMIEKCLRKKPDERYRTAGELVRIFEIVLGASSGRFRALTPSNA